VIEPGDYFSETDTFLFARGKKHTVTGTVTEVGTGMHSLDSPVRPRLRLIE
jgi:hypothetical protein